MRKLSEAWLATLVEWRYSKEQILEAYLNEIYLGQRGGLAIRGVGAAARAYFRKEIHQLTPARPRSSPAWCARPTRYSPVVDPERARERRDVVLARMRELGMLTAADFERARSEPVRAAAGRRPRPARAVLHRLRAARARAALRRRRRSAASVDHDSTSRCSASPRRRWPRPRPAGDALRRGCAARAARAAAGRAGRARSGHRRDPRPGRRARLPGEPVQPRRAGAAPAGLRLQAVRLPGGARARATAPALHRRLDRGGLADHAQRWDGKPGARATTRTATRGG